MNLGQAYRYRQVIITYMLLMIVFCLTIGPFLWLLSTALKSSGENIFKFPPDLIPLAPTLNNFWAVFKAVPFGTYFFNSLVVSGLIVICQVIFCSLAAYPLSRMDFAGRKIVFYAIVSTMMIPGQITMIPLFVMASSMGLRNSFFGLILPGMIGAFGIFLLRQAFMAIPKALEEAAIIDGMAAWQIWWYILLPLIKPAIAALAIFSFVGAWGDFMWPLLISDDPASFTLALGVQQLAGTFTLDWRLVSAGAVLSIIPIIVVFAVCQRYFISGAMSAGVKE